LAHGLRPRHDADQDQFLALEFGNPERVCSRMSKFSVDLLLDGGVTTLQLIKMRLDGHWLATPCLQHEKVSLSRRRQRVDSLSLRKWIFRISRYEGM
jgi:hypothetical protein